MFFLSNIFCVCIVCVRLCRVESGGRRADGIGRACGCFISSTIFAVGSLASIPLEKEKKNKENTIQSIVKAKSSSLSAKFHKTPSVQLSRRLLNDAALLGAKY